MNIQDEILSLKKTIQELDHHYYQKSHPLTTDLEYDQLVQRLKHLESLVGADPDSPTKTITDTKDPSFKEIKHLTPMLSLSNVFVPSQGNVFIPSTGDKDYLAKFLASLQGMWILLLSTSLSKRSSMVLLAISSTKKVYWYQQRLVEMDLSVKMC